MKIVNGFNEKTILIVDDSEVIREIIRREAKKYGFKDIYQAEDGREAIEVYKEKTPDIVLMDFKMPYKNGLETSEEIINYDPKAKVVLMSAVRNKEFKIQAFLRGVAYYVIKPFLKEELMDIVYNVLFNNIDKSKDKELKKYKKISVASYKMENYEEREDLEEYVKIIGEMFMKLKGNPKDYSVLEILEDNINTLGNKKINLNTLKRVELLKTKVNYFDEGLINFDDAFFEECMYILNDIRKGVKSV